MRDGAGLSRRSLPAPLWALLMLPFAVASGFVAIAVPFAFRSRGLSMTLVGVVTQIAMLPHVIKPLWSPLLDSGPRRRTWYFGSVFVAAIALAATALVPLTPHQMFGPLPVLWVYTVTLFVAQAAVATSGSAVLAMMAVSVPDEGRGAASGWLTAGNLAGTAVGGSLITWLQEHASTTATAAVLAAICALSAAPAVIVDESPLRRRSAKRLVADLLKEVWRTLRSREGWTGMVICMSPVGAGGLAGLFSGLAVDYAPDRAGATHLAVVVTGLFGGVANIGGALLGGVLADRMNRRLAYALCGGLSAICAVAMLVAPTTPGAFTAGSLAYQFVNGLCYGVFYAFVFELVGNRDGVTTQLALYVGAANLASAYVSGLDSYAYDVARGLAPGWASAGRVGMLGMDALTSVLGLAVLGAMTVYVRRTGQRSMSP